MYQYLVRLFLCISLFSVVGCYNPEDFDNAEFDKENFKKFFQLKTNFDSISADGSSLVEIQAIISKLSKLEYREIELTTTKGVFSPQGTKTIKIKADEFYSEDTSLIVAKATLQSEPSETSATITAKVRYLEQSTKVKFYRVPPTSISVESLNFFITQSLASRDTIQATLKRDIGTPTAGHPVEFFVINNVGDTVVNTIRGTGFFRAHSRKSNEKGISSIIFSLGENYLGQLKIISSTSVEQVVMIDSTFIEVIK